MRSGASLRVRVVSELRLPGQALALLRALQRMARMMMTSQRRGTADKLLVPPDLFTNS